MVMNTYPDRILVLDLDGCVTSIKDGTYFNPDPSKYHPSEKLVIRLKKFCKDNNVKILISSNWRKFDIDGSWTNKYGTYKNPLPKAIAMLGDLYYGILPPTRHVNKSQALVNWFTANPDFNGEFAIFDDDLREQFQNTEKYGISTRFVHIDPMTGITDDNLSSAKKIMNI